MDALTIISLVTYGLLGSAMAALTFLNPHRHESANERRRDERRD